MTIRNLVQEKELDEVTFREIKSAESKAVQSHIDEFLAAGGKIEQIGARQGIDPNVRSWKL